MKTTGAFGVPRSLRQPAKKSSLIAVGFMLFPSITMFNGNPYLSLTFGYFLLNQAAGSSVSELSFSKSLSFADKAELFCLAAEEAKELCLPIVTLGIGCLEERVEDGKTGFVARSVKEFSDYTIELFKNDDLWNEMRKYLISIRGKKNWINVAKDLINQL